MNLSKNMRLLAALLLIIIITVIIGTVFSYCLNFIFGLFDNKFETGDKLYLTGNDDDLEECWNLIRERTGNPGYSAALYDFLLKRNADGVVGSFILKYYIQKDGEWYSYSVTYRDNVNNTGGRISVLDSPVKPGVPDFAKEYPLDPGEFMKSLDLLNLTYLGYEDSIIDIESGNIRGSILYFNEYDYAIYLQEENRLLPLEMIVFEDSKYPAFPVTVSKMECSDKYGTVSCSSSDASIVFLNSRVNHAEYSILNRSCNDEQR